jgi:hypothetical protein
MCLVQLHFCSQGMSSRLVFFHQFSLLSQKHYLLEVPCQVRIIVKVFIFSEFLVSITPKDMFLAVYIFTFWALPEFLHIFRVILVVKLCFQHSSLWQPSGVKTQCSQSRTQNVHRLMYCCPVNSTTRPCLVFAPPVSTKMLTQFCMDKKMSEKVSLVLFFSLTFLDTIKNERAGAFCCFSTW